MKTFSISDVISEAFRVGFGRPIATTAWGFVLTIPTFIALAAFAPMFADFSQNEVVEVVEADGLEHLSWFWQLQILSQLANLLQLVCMLVVTTAIGRAVLSGRRRDPFLFFRFGRDELYVAVVGIVIGVGAMLALMVVVLLALAIGLSLKDMADPWRTLTYVAMAVGITVGFLLLWGRLALMAPASLRYGVIGFEQGWRLGRGQTWRLLAVMLLIGVLYLAFGLALLLLAVVISAALGWAGPAPFQAEMVEAWFEGLSDPPAWLFAAGVAVMLPLSWVQGFSQVLATAPFAKAVQVLAEQAPVEAGPATPEAEGL